MGNSNIVVAYPDLDRVHLDTMVHITCRLTGYQIDASLYLVLCNLTEGTMLLSAVFRTILLLDALSCIKCVEYKLHCKVLSATSICIITQLAW